MCTLCAYVCFGTVFLLSSCIESVIACFHRYLKQRSFAGVQKTKAVFA